MTFEQLTDLEQELLADAWLADRKRRLRPFSEGVFYSLGFAIAWLKMARDRDPIGMAGAWLLGFCLAAMWARSVYLALTVNRVRITVKEFNLHPEDERALLTSLKDPKGTEGIRARLKRSATPKPSAGGVKEGR